MTQLRSSFAAEWPRRPLGELCKIVARQVDPTEAEYSNLPHINGENIESGTGRILWMNSAREDGMTSGKYLFGEGDVLYSKLRPYLRKVAIAPCRGLCSADMYPIQVDPSILEPSFAAWMLLSESFTQYADEESRRARMPKLNREQLFAWMAPVPPLAEQRRIAAVLNEELAAVEQARAAAKVQYETTAALAVAYVRESLSSRTGENRIGDCADEVLAGVGHSWRSFPVLGSTREGLAPAKEGVGKNPQRYKRVDPGTVFYNPMRIMIGSIAMLGDAESPGITSPDYVVLKPRRGVLNSKWFYTWFRSAFGENLIKSLARGAVRERILFRRLAQGTIDLPTWDAQCFAAQRIVATEELQQRIATQLESIRHLPLPLMRSAFQGKL